MAAKYKRDEEVIQIINPPIIGKVTQRMVDGDEDKYLVEWTDTEIVEGEEVVHTHSRWFSEDEIQPLEAVTK